MKLSSFSGPVFFLLAAAILTGCSTAPATAPAEKLSGEAGGSAVADAAPSAGAPRAGATPTAITPAGAVAAKSVSGVDTAPGLSKEAAEFVARFTQPGGGDAQQHKLTDTTSFPEAMSSLEPGARAPKFDYVPSMRPVAPVQGLTADGNSTQLIVRDWTGLVLVPISTSLSIAHTSSVRLLKVEAHPLSDGRVRIWVRVQNAGRKDIASEVACSFQMMGGKTVASPYFYELPVPSADYRDVFFVSPEGKLSTYTVLVRQGR